jgi:DNA-binding CsgD family transcriptional regulator
VFGATPAPRASAAGKFVRDLRGAGKHSDLTSGRTFTLTFQRTPNRRGEERTHANGATGADYIARAEREITTAIIRFGRAYNKDPLSRVEPAEDGGLVASCCGRAASLVMPGRARGDPVAPANRSAPASGWLCRGRNMTNEPEGSSDLVALSADILAAYVMKNHIPGEELPTLIAAIHDALKSAATEVNNTQPTQSAVAIDELLTRRETEIARFVAAGLSNRQIAQKVSLAEATVKIHLHNAYRKLGIANRSMLAVIASSGDRGGTRRFDLVQAEAMHAGDVAIKPHDRRGAASHGGDTGRRNRGRDASALVRAANASLTLAGARSANEQLAAQV